MGKLNIADDIVRVIEACFSDRISELRADPFTEDRDMVPMSQVQTYEDIVENAELIQFIIGLDKDSLWNSAPVLRKAFKMLDDSYKHKRGQRPMSRHQGLPTSLSCSP